MVDSCHESHQLRGLARARERACSILDQGAAFPAHALLETYSVLTGFPPPHRAAPRLVGRLGLSMLLEAFAPDPDAVEFHRIAVDAPPEVVYRTLWSVDFARSPLVGGLLVLRALPGLFRGRRARGARGARPFPRRLTLHEVMAAGFGRLAEEPGREIVLGVSGRFWRLTGNLEPFDPEGFSRPVPAGMARAVWNFRVLPRGERGSLLSTETRVTCGDPESRRRFRRYWLVVRPFSGLIRILMLRAVRRAAEAKATRATSRG